MSNKALVVKNETSLANLGEIFARSGYFQDARQAAQAVVKIMAGQELGLPPIASMTGIHIIKGKVSLSATTMAAVLKRHGSYDYRVLEHNDTKCKIEFLRREVYTDERGIESLGIGISEFTMEDAKVAGLMNGTNYKKYPRNMLFARAMSNGIRWYCPDILGGPAYTPGELEHKADEGAGDEQPEIEVIDESEVDIFAEALRIEDDAKVKAQELLAEGKNIMEISQVLDREYPGMGYDDIGKVGGLLT